jgi:cobalt-zinc-cadmium efflux system protein
VSHQHPATASAGERSLDRRLGLTAGLNVAITVAEFVGGLLSGSLALLSDAAHNLGDVVAVVLALWARRVSRRPATLRHTYGFQRVEVIAALTNAVLLLAATVLIAREAVVRLLHPQPVAQGIMLFVGSVAFVANVGSVLLLRRHEAGDVNVRSAFLHLAQDALASLAVVVAALLARTRVGPWVDPVAALLVGFVVLRGALALVRETLSTLMEGVPEGLDVAALAASVAAAFAPAQLHHVHVWEVGPGQRVLTAHVALGEERDARAVGDLLARIKARLHDQWGITHATLEPELESCGESGLLGSWKAAARPAPGAGGTHRATSMDTPAGRPARGSDDGG